MNAEPYPQRAYVPLCISPGCAWTAIDNTNLAKDIADTKHLDHEAFSTPITRSNSHMAVPANNRVY